ncbi:ParM/StbA family protein [Natranaerobius thermophilus]|uniref:Actin-like protein N-terminal domain-containing protein n=1 Tax=Natranaerobius thermophilus (strain ATCC BAA-1301 / DSM 18059 / JW/NM-WN-LF) TaxID=457570 RepID=B2A5C1_NATTJ|nr:ParM/StbA family protein [Natranaerobius thermophilus]ACB83955.1 hypothetical protein Nther_0358 [Natranaerobius thermophilus JW/NM-WN-LF]
MIVAVDAGNYETKVVNSHGKYSFYSDIGEYRERKLNQKHGSDDMEWEYQGERGFAGSLAKFESEYGGSMMGDSKYHRDGLLRVLLALHQYCDDNNFKIVVGQPISSHTQAEKQRIKEMLEGDHILTVNGVKKTIRILNCQVAAEGASAFWIHPQGGCVRMLDIGSGTINAATILDRRYVDKDSFTINFGANSNLTNDVKEMANAIIRKSHKWNKDDRVWLIGGIAEEIEPYLTGHFKNLKVLKPNGLHSKWANVLGYYALASGLYE